MLTMEYIIIPVHIESKLTCKFLYFTLNREVFQYSILVIPVLRKMINTTTITLR